RRAGGAARAGPVHHRVPRQQQVAVPVRRELGGKDSGAGQGVLVQRPRLSRRRGRAVLPLLAARGRAVPPRVPRADRARLRWREGTAMSDEKDGPFVRDELLDKPGLVGARWWHKGLQDEERAMSRRAALRTMLIGGGVVGGVALVGAGISEAFKP